MPRNMVNFRILGKFKERKASSQLRNQGRLYRGRGISVAIKCKQIQAKRGRYSRLEEKEAKAERVGSKGLLGNSVCLLRREVNVTGNGREGCKLQPDYRLMFRFR